MFRYIFKSPVYITAVQSLKYLTSQVAKPIGMKSYANSTTIRHEVSQAIVLRRFYSEQARNEEVIVDYDYVKNATTNKNILVIDVREPNEVKEHGKIPNSVNIPLGNVSNALGTMSEKEFEKLYNIPKPTEETEIIFYCMIGKRSGMAQQNTINLGYKNVKNYLGSWLDWESKTRLSN